MKNIDKLRELSADELAELLELGSCVFCSLKFFSCTCDDCVSGIKKWLESEVEE